MTKQELLDAILNGATIYDIDTRKPIDILDRLNANTLTTAIPVKEIIIPDCSYSVAINSDGSKTYNYCGTPTSSLGKFMNDKLDEEVSGIDCISLKIFIEGLIDRIAEGE